MAVHHGLHYTMPERSRLPVVVTVHDCTYFDHPEWHQRAKVPFFRRADPRLAAERAAVVVCVSEATVARFTELCRPRARVVVAPHGIDHTRFCPAEPADGEDTAELAALGVDATRPLVVFVGTLEPRKGVAGLVAAFDRVAGDVPDVLLVLAGQPGWGRDATPLSASRHPERVLVTGDVPDRAVPALFRSAAVVAYPSLDEGFGLPAFEALACGAPVVTTSGTPMAAALDDAAVLVAPGDVEALGEALLTVVAGTRIVSAGARPVWPGWPGSPGRPAWPTTSRPTAPPPGATESDARSWSSEGPGRSWALGRPTTSHPRLTEA